MFDGLVPSIHDSLAEWADERLGLGSVDETDLVGVMKAEAADRGRERILFLLLELLAGLGRRFGGAELFFLKMTCAMISGRVDIAMVECFFF